MDSFRFAELASPISLAVLRGGRLLKTTSGRHLWPVASYRCVQRVSLKQYVLGTASYVTVEEVESRSSHSSGGFSRVSGVIRVSGE